MQVLFFSKPAQRRRAFFLLRVVQDLQNLFWTEEEVNKKLKEMLSRTFHEVIELSHKERASASDLLH
jgi:glutamate dehydrogenase/leucine dehydrogenase